MLKGLNSYSMVNASLRSNAQVSSRYVVKANHSGFLPGPGGSGSTSGTSSSGSTGGGFNMVGTGIATQYTGSITEQFFNLNDHVTMRKIYRNIYLQDLIAGTAVDMQANLPFSDFTISGIPDAKMLDVFARSIEATNIKSLLPNLSVDYQVYGTFCAAMNMDYDKRYFTSIIPLDLNDCEFTALPQYGRDPLIDYFPSEALIKLIELSTKDPRLSDLKSFIPDVLEMPKGKGKGKRQAIPLRPEITLYLARKAFAGEPLGRSYFERILMVHLYEKLVQRGSAEMVMRRLRPLMHIIAGQGDEWIPTDADLNDIASTFQAADIDPISAILVTREGISTNEIRQPSDFLSYNNEYEQLSTMKLRALGLTEVLLTGEATYNTLDSSMTVFLENLRAYREMVIRAVFKNKMFPLISVINNFKKQKETKVFGKYASGSTSAFSMAELDGPIASTASNYNYTYVTANGEDIDLREVDLTQFYMPKITFQKTLRPVADEAYLNILNQASEKGIPIPLRVYAAVCGLDIPDIMSSLDDDIKLREKINQYQEKIPKPKGAPDGDEGDALASIATLANMKKNRIDTTELRDPLTKRVLSPKGKKVMEEQIHKNMAAFLGKYRDNNKHRFSKQFGVDKKSPSIKL